MLPCRRGALLAKSASFKKIPEDIEINHENLTKSNPKTVQKPITNSSQKRCGQILKNITENTANLAILDPILEQCSLNFKGGERFVSNLVSGTFAEHPQG